MDLTDGGRKYEAVFWHSKPGYLCGWRMTHAKLLDRATGDVLGEGRAWCNPRDNFRKETGRKLSLLRAMVAAGFGKERRTQVWASYLRQRGFVLAEVARGPRELRPRLKETKAVPA